MVPFRARAVSRNQFCMFLLFNIQFIFFYFDISEPRARARTVSITFLSVTFTKLFSDDSVPRARALTEPVLHVFVNKKMIYPQQISICIAFLYMEHSEMTNRVHAKQSSYGET